MANWKIADGYVEVHLKEDIDGDLKKSLAKVGDREGQAIGRRIARGVGEGVSDVDVRVQRHLNKIDGSEPGKKVGREFLTGFTEQAGRLPGEFERTGDRAGSGMVRGFDRHSRRMGILAKTALASLPAAGLAAGTLMGAGIGIATGAITALGAVALRTDATVSGAFTDMADDVGAGVQRAARPLAPFLVGIAHDVETSFASVEDDLQDLFAATGPNARILAGGLLDLAENALPGFVTGMRQSREESEGLANFLGSAGAGLGGFFSELTEGGEESRITLTALGDVVESLLTKSGTALRFLSEGAASFADDFVSTLDGILEFAGGLGTGFFPVLTGAFSGLLDVASGATAILGPIAPILGGIGAAALVGAAGLKVFESVNRMWSGATGQVAKYGTAARGSAAQTRGLGARVAALGGFLGGPLGIGLSVATLGLGLFGDGMQENQRRAQATADRVAGLRDAVMASGGVITGQTRAFIDQTVAAGNLSAGLRDAGITQDMLTRAIEGTGNSFAVVDEAYGQMIARSIEANGVTSDETLTLMRNADEFHQLADARKRAAEAAREQSAAMRDSTGYMFQQAQSTQELSEAFAKYGADSKNATENLTALQGIVRGTAPELTTVADAQQVWNDRLRSMNEEIKGGIDKADGFGKSLLNVDGSLNTVSENGSKLRSFLTGAREDMVTLGKSVFDESQRMGDSVEVSSDKARKALEGQRKSVLDVAKAFGISGKDAEALLRQMNLFPDEIVSKIRLAGATELTRELAGVDALLDKVRPGVPVRVNALTADAVAKLSELGFKVEQLEDNSWQVSIEDSAARAKLDAFLKDADAGLLKPKQIGLDTQRARDEMLGFAAWATENASPYVTVDADVTKAYAETDEFQQAVWSSNPYVTVGALTGPGYDAVEELITTADQSWAAPEIGANVAPGTDAVGGFLGWAEAAWATPEIGANTGPAFGTTSGFLAWADSAWADSNIGADAGSAYATLGGVLSAVNRSRATITIGARYVGPTTRAADYYGGAGAATGAVLGFGPRGVQAFADGGVMRGYTPGRDVHVFRSPTGGTLKLSGGEAVMRPEWTAAVGPAYVRAANAAARAGQARRFLAAQAMSENRAARSQSFADGGIMGATLPPSAAPVAAPGAGLSAASIAAAVADGVTAALSRARLTLDNRSGAVMAQIVANRQLSNAGR